MSSGSPVVQVRIKPDVRDRLEKAQEKIESYSGEKMGLSTIIRHALDQYLDYVLSPDTLPDDLKNVPKMRKALDSLSIVDEVTKRKIIQELDFKEA